MSIPIPSYTPLILERPWEVRLVWFKWRACSCWTNGPTYLLTTQSSAISSSLSLFSIMNQSLYIFMFTSRQRYGSRYTSTVFYLFIHSFLVQDNFHNSLESFKKRKCFLILEHIFSLALLSLLLCCMISSLWVYVVVSHERDMWMVHFVLVWLKMWSSMHAVSFECLLKHGTPVYCECYNIFDIFFNLHVCLKWLLIPK